MRCPRPDFIDTEQPMMPDTTAAAPRARPGSRIGRNNVRNATTPRVRDTIAAAFMRGAACGGVGGGEAGRRRAVPGDVLPLLWLRQGGPLLRGHARHVR